VSRKQQGGGGGGGDAMTSRHPLLLLMRFVRGVLLTQIATTLDECCGAYVKQQLHM
jgi:hypothetical protein